jgi:type IV pilus assembly protein PilC
MPTFTYTARDRAGQVTTGVIASNNVTELRETLRNKELFVTSIKQQGVSEENSGLFSSLRRRKVKLGDMVVMSRQLATLVRAGITIIDCLNSVAVQTENPLLAKTMQQVRLDVMTGSTLADAMRKHPKVFSEMYISLVQAGEVGGVLESTLETAATQFDKEADLREKIKSAFVYPAIVLIGSIAVVFFMLVFIVPVFANVYQQFHAELPPITQFLVSLSYVIVHYFLFVLVGVVLAFLGIRKYIESPAGRYVYDQMKLKLPLLGKLNRKIAVARFTQTFAGATRAGVPILSTLAVSAQTCGNVVIMKAIKKVAGFVKEGTSISVPLEATGEFPSMVTRMIAAGEHSGNLDEMLEEIAKFYNRDIEYTVQKLTRIMEPAMTVVVGGIVLFVLLALYMPVFNLTQVVHK